VRLSYWDRIQKVLPPTFHGLLPPKPEVQVGPARAVPTQALGALVLTPGLHGPGARACAHWLLVCPLVSCASSDACVTALVPGQRNWAVLTVCASWRPCMLHRAVHVLRMHFLSSGSFWFSLFCHVMQWPAGAAGAGAAAAPSRERPGERRPEWRCACGGGNGAGCRDARGARGPGHGVPTPGPAHTPRACLQPESRRARQAPRDTACEQASRVEAPSQADPAGALAL